MNKVQKEYYLREQLKAIQKELGEEEDINSEADEYREKLKKIGRASCRERVFATV